MPCAQFVCTSDGSWGLRAKEIYEHALQQETAWIETSRTHRGLGDGIGRLLRDCLHISINLDEALHFSDGEALQGQMSLRLGSLMPTMQLQHRDAGAPTQSCPHVAEGASKAGQGPARQVGAAGRAQQLIHKGKVPSPAAGGPACGRASNHKFIYRSSGLPTTSSCSLV